MEKTKTVKYTLSNNNRIERPLLTEVEGYVFVSYVVDLLEDTCVETWMLKEEAEKKLLVTHQQIIKMAKQKGHELNA